MKKKLSIAAIPDIGGGSWRYERCKPWFTKHVLFHVIPIPGFGGQAADPKLDSMEEYADYICGKIKELPAPRYIFATGTGASMALQLIQNEDRRPHGLILHAPVWNRPHPQPFPKLFQHEWLRPLLLKAMVSRTFRNWMRKQLFRQPVPDFFADHFFEEYARCEIFGHLFRLITPEWFQTLKPVSIPSLILWGGNEVRPPQEHINSCRQILPDAEVKFIKEWDYFPMIEQPRSFANALLNTTMEMQAKKKQPAAARKKNTTRAGW